MAGFFKSEVPPTESENDDSADDDETDDEVALNDSEGMFSSVSESAPSAKFWFCRSCDR